MKHILSLEVYTCDNCGLITTDIISVTNRWVFIEKSYGGHDHYCTQECADTKTFEGAIDAVKTA